ncbi:hypothetical protein PH213_20510 [Streptomyces sp. SRF1]|uniref:hypothetical protein n=1 Tax=Streptomyces sp. SRF1 TaxID=1549642 RepID=UPI0025B10A90|nr:hypothetical protein [Streptomyces sp. SRF1]MDN3056890.1 hypothetical protein [Streptomyces sp. SRF1]
MSTDTPNQRPRIPGVRYRKVKRNAWEPVTFNGETKMIRREWTEEVPRLPLNLDLLYVRAAVGVAILLTGVAVVWSTMAIGRQLGHLVPEHPRVGYLGAAAFELPWVTCLAIGWVLRTQPDRARPVNVAGWIGLGIVVSAIILDGYRVDAIEVGILGAFVSIVAKGLWWVIVGLFHVELDDDRAGWLNAKRQDLSVARVMLGEQQRMSGTEAYLAYFGMDPAATARPAFTPATSTPAAELSASSVPAGPPAAPTLSAPPAPKAPAAPMTVPAVSGQAPVVSAPVLRQPSAPVFGQVPTAPAHAPGPVSGHVPAPCAPVSGQPVQTPPQPAIPPVSPPSGQGVDVSGQPSGPAPAASPQLTAPVPPSPPVGAPNGEQEPPTAPHGGAHPIGASIAATVRQLLNDTPAWAVDEPLPEAELKAMTKKVRRVCGDRPRLEETVRRTRDRELKRSRKTA